MTNFFVIPEGNLLLQFEFKTANGSVFLSESEDLANLLLAMNALKALPWFPKMVRGGSGKLNTGEGGGSRLNWPKMA